MDLAPDPSPSGERGRNRCVRNVICRPSRRGARPTSAASGSTARPLVGCRPSRHPVGALRKSTRRCAVVPHFRRRSARCARFTSRKCSTSRTFVSISYGARRGPAAICGNGSWAGRFDVNAAALCDNCQSSYLLPLAGKGSAKSWAFSRVLREGVTSPRRWLIQPRACPKYALPSDG